MLSEERPSVQNHPSQSKSIAVFDIDWTLLCGTSAESLLFLYLRKKKIIPFRNIIKTWFRTIIRLPDGFVFSFLENKYYLRGIELQSIQKLLPSFYEQILSPVLSKDLLDEMSELRNRGYIIYLISGTLDFIVDFLVRQWGAAGGAGSCLEIRNGRITGSLVGHYPIHYRKVSLLKCLLDGKPVDWNRSIAYGDSVFDLPLLSLFGNVVAVHPDVGLLKEARRRGWRIISRSPRTKNPLFRIWIEKFYRKV